MKKVDYYEFLQISPRADQETIHRVYRFLGARFHPDNPESGDAEKFAMLKTAYEVLSDPVRRAEYDLAAESEEPGEQPLSQSIDFMDSVEGEMNRRVGVLAVLYFQRRSNASFPEVRLAEIERRLGFPRDYLDFASWYLQQKGYIIQADNADFTLTAKGVDFIETQRANIPILNKLLTDGMVKPPPKSYHPRESTDAASGTDTPPVVEKEAKPLRRLGAGDRRVKAPDPRAVQTERRTGKGDRRISTQDRRVGSPDRRLTKDDRRENE